MSIELKVNVEEFQRVAEAILRTSSRTYPKFLNGQALRVASNAIQATDKADRVAIERQMGVVGRKETLRGANSGGKKGWVRISKRELIDNSFAARIINARKKAMGVPLIWGKELSDAARKMVAAKVRSVAFIRSGWIPAVRALSKEVYTRGAFLARDAKQVGAPKGYAIPARVTISGLVTVEIGNTALLHQSKFNAWHGRKGDPIPVAVKGLQAGMNAATRDMATEFYKRMGEDLKPFGATQGP